MAVLWLAVWLVAIVNLLTLNRSFFGMVSTSSVKRPHGWSVWNCFCTAQLWTIHAWLLTLVLFTKMRSIVASMVKFEIKKRYWSWFVISGMLSMLSYTPVWSFIVCACSLLLFPKQFGALLSPSRCFANLHTSAFSLRKTRANFVDSPQTCSFHTPLRSHCKKTPK